MRDCRDSCVQLNQLASRISTAAKFVLMDYLQHRVDCSIHDEVIVCIFILYIFIALFRK